MAKQNEKPSLNEAAKAILLSAPHNSSIFSTERIEYFLDYLERKENKR